MSKRGKNYRAAAEKVDREKLYEPAEAVALAKETAFTKFDATIEVHMRLGVDPRHADQQVRDVVMLPHGLGKTMRVVVFAQGDAAKAARHAGADVVAEDEADVKEVENGPMDFDVAISTPEMMGMVGRLGRVLGPRGLMPNPKAGTVVNEGNMGQAIEEAKAGRVEFRLDKTANLHVAIGKASFDEQQLNENLAALMEAVVKARPAAAKGAYIRRMTLAATMGPGIKVDPNLAQAMENTD
ncbi:MAG: 50S ribosomal protein L1 [Chloroflexi bacterium]|nr:MAG: 50S ribosomal protein L1 [Chloroflexota bacterium]MBL1196115.1 50S ribosomal protein L1 [Chloroflexota bacterium]NOH13408.1 50S ribosomal protein L1 [Chloroflexota bacterium]